MRRIVVGLLSAGLCLAACGGGGLGPDDGAGGDTAESAQPGRLALATDGSLGSRLRLALVRPKTYRPDDVVLTDQSAVIVSDLLYDGLTEAVGSEGTLRPGLAASWSAEADFTRWTFALDPEAGVSADVVVDGLDPLTARPGRNVERASPKAALAAGIETIEAVDPWTVRMELAAPNAGLPWILSGLPYSIVGPDGAPTGRYRIASDDSNGLLLRRSAERPGEVDAATEVLVTWVDDGAAAYALLVDGLVDAAVADSDSISDAATRFEAGFPATTAVRFYVLNRQSDALGDARMRQAVVAAVDRRALVDHAFGYPVAESDGLLASTAAGHRPGACGTACRHDPALAAGLLSDSASPRIEVAYVGVDQQAAAAAIVEQLRAVGFEATGRELQPEDLAAVIVDGGSGVFSFGWVAPATSADAVLPPLLTAGSPANVAKIDVPAVADLLSRASVTADDEDRWTLLDQAHRLAMAENLLLPVAGPTSMLVRAPGAAALVVRADGSIDLETSR